MTHAHSPTAAHPPYGSHAAGITVFTPYFAARTPERQAELDLCLHMNLQCDAVTRLVLLVDDGHQPPTTHPKLTVRAMPGRPSYLQWIELSTELPAGGVSILANTDIYFDDSLRRVHETLAAPQRFMALSRFEKLGAEFKPHPTPNWSQDVWGLRTGQDLPAPLLKALDIPLGVPRCDNKIAYLFAVHGWTVHNPMAFVRSVHVHETQQRNYDKKTDMTVMGGVAYVDPSKTLAAPSTLEFDVWARNTPLVKSVKLNRSMDHWLAQAAEKVAAAGASVTPNPALALDAAPVCLPVDDFPAIGRALHMGEVAYALRGRFKVYRLDGRHMAVDSLSPALAQWLRPGLAAGERLVLDAPTLLAAFVPPVVDTSPIAIGLRPTDKADCHFWQYPAATERQAFENHLGLARGANIDAAARVVHTYLGLPWATYIDKKQLPDEVLKLNGLRLAGLHALAQALGFELRVHTVCQQIYWRRLIDTFQQLRVTDLHLSHATTDIDPAREGWALRIHSWPLFAPNIEVPERRVGLTIGKPVEQKRYLASFIGAHMPHYRSDVRVRLFEAAKASGRDDILVDLGNEWHFNKIVYKEQVQNKALTVEDGDKESLATVRYNEIVSESVFSICPEGAGPNTLRIWESMAVGSIPIILARGWLPPQRMNVDLEDCCVFVDPENVETVFTLLSKIDEARVNELSRKCISNYQTFRFLDTFRSK
jgi:hypothetical protein